ncbi:hypothetical protein RM704_18525 [Streptomyces sp. DSM 3412]|uniref:Helix-turn-helix domain-containing protein n=1 Tax=Streptomyces gottesmaniae TaxID=3075518 RepID=A0ABU2Z1A9_9ACTN|nr:hypothetical protein [Streptomyces sp. DSM 3412]MDT0569444.1 hypothetical protein [Streptomyces sp. DSM 3412]
MTASTKTPEISPTERIRTLAHILSGRITPREAARRHDLPVRVVRQWLREIPVAAPTDAADRSDRPARAHPTGPAGRTDLPDPADRPDLPAPANRADRGSVEDTAPARTDRRPLPRCRVVVDQMVQGLGL